MRTIVITRPDFRPGETEAIARKFEEGLEILHLRKPESTVEAYEALLLAIPARYWNRIMLHDHHTLALKYPIRGVHLNSRNPMPPQGFTGAISCSCHSLSEVVERKPACEYVFLSPIFDSISKQGYTAAFSAEQLEAAHQEGIIDEKVYALGGVTKDKYPLLSSWGFGGAVLLGAAWQVCDTTENIHPINR